MTTSKLPKPPGSADKAPTTVATPKIEHDVQICVFTPKLWMRM